MFYIYIRAQLWIYMIYMIYIVTYIHIHIYNHACVYVFGRVANMFYRLV